MTGAELFALEALEVKRGARRVVAGLSFGLHPGECVALVGPSGSGKTTSCLAPFGLLSGKAELGGRYRLGDGLYRVGEAPGSGSVRMALLLQAPGDNFSPDVAIGSQLADASGLHRARAAPVLEEARSLAAELGLDDFGELIRRPPAWVSRGELQRLALVAALLSRPRLLVADEPTAALDAANRRRWCALVNRWREATGLAVWLATHDRQVGQALGARAVVLAQDAVPDEGLATGRPCQPNPAVAADAVVRLGDRALHPGKALVIVGASGSGKSTLLRRIAGLATAASAVRQRAGEPPLDVPPLPRGRHGLAMVFQDPRSGLNPHRAVGDSIAAVLRRCGVRESAASTAWLQAELAGLDLPADCATRRPVALSLGQMQRVALILALASSPRLLLCDEPTSALGRTHRQRMVERLRLAMANGVGLIIATHDRALIDELGADPWSMDRGGEESGGG